MLKKQLMYEENYYIKQYHNAVFLLMNGNDIVNVLYPLINLINQVIENEIKSLIIETHFDKQTFKDLKIDNTHDLKKLIEHRELKKYYDGIDYFEKTFQKYKDDVLYFYNILGEDTFLNSRYPIQRMQNEITVKNSKISIEEFYKRWGSYSIGYSKIMEIYIAYSYSNNITYIKTNGGSDEEINSYIKEVEEQTILDFEIDGIDKTIFDTKSIYSYVDMFLNRNIKDGNKYVDFKYCK